jgi:serine/threonine protein kinase/WD40 repeat protein
MAVADVHPSVEELTEFTLGTLDEEAQAPIEGHVASCASCQERAANAPGDRFVDLLRSAHAYTSRGADTVVVAAAQVQTPVSFEAVAVTDALAPAVGPSASAESGRPKVPDAVPPELVRLERYLVVRLLGAGGMGAVYEAEHRVMRRRVAVKIIRRDYTANPNALERFRGEVENAARLSHPNIVTTYDAEDAGETLFLVMEYVEGTDLGRLVQEHGPFPVDRACDYVRQAALGLQYAFEQGMVHRDLKPHNLMLTPDGRVKILDFGLAHFASEAAPAACRTGTGVVLGTVDYIAPEQADNAHQADIRSDIYSLGCTLYHLLAGQPPFPTGTPIQKVMAHVEKKPQPLTELRDDLPEGLMPVIDRMMAKKPKRRYQRPIEVATALERFTPPSASDAGRSRTLVLPKPPAPNRLRIVALAASLFFIIAGLLGGAVYRIATDKGELVITTESDDVKVVITHGGKLVDVIDTKTDEQIRLTLRSGEYDLELKGAPKGLKLNIDKATLTRGETVLARITTETPKPSASKYLTLPIDKVASAVSTKSLFSGSAQERLIFPKWGRQEVFGVPFDVIDPKGDSVKNAIVFCSPHSPLTRERPLAVSLKCGSPANAIHLLSGVAGSGWGCADPEGNKKRVCVIIRLHYRDGWEEDHELINGLHFCDYVNGNEVPGSQRAIVCDTRPHQSQMRYLAIQPRSPTKVIEEIELIKGMKGDVTAPVIMAVTVERSSSSAERIGEIRRFGAEGHRMIHLALSPDGQRLLTASVEGSAQYWDIATGKEIYRLPGAGGQVYGVAISPDGTKLLSCGGDRLIHVWDAANGLEVKQLTGHTDEVHGVAISPDGRIAASSGNDCQLRLWNLDTGELIASPGNAGGGLGAAFSPDGKLIATWANDHMVRLWDVKERKELRCLEGHKEWVAAGAFSRDGSRLLTGTWPPELVVRPSDLKLWEVATGKLLRTIDVIPGSVHGLAISPDGRQALSGGASGLVQLWDLERGQAIMALTGHIGHVSDVAFLPGGRTAVSVGFDATIRLWRLPDPPADKENP